MSSSNKTDNQIYVVMYIFVALFLAMMVNFVRYVQFDSREDINNSYNTRQENLAAKVVRGQILSSDEQVLAYTEVGAGGEEVRRYPFKGVFAHVVGYSTKGKSGIESIANISLLTSNTDITERITNDIAEEKNIGDNIVTTLDVGLQQTAYEALGVYKGAIVAMEPDSGKILAMVSNPGFDPNNIVLQWDELNAMTETSPLINRATQGLYPPGSTFKIATLLEYIRENKEPEDYSYNCTGSYMEDGIVINCFHGSVHGQLTLRRSFAKSCNSSFANIGSSLKASAFRSTAEDLLFNKDIPIRLSHKSSSFTYDAGCATEERLHSAIGQGKTLVTPIHMALITSAIADGGILKKPCLIDRIENYRGGIVKRYKPSIYKRLMSEEEAAFLTDYMKSVVTEGTGSKLAGLSYEVAGKTGSAEFGTDKGESHAWFTGFGGHTAEDGSFSSDIVVTVIVEGAGSGSDYAVPMAKRVLDAYYR